MSHSKGHSKLTASELAEVETLTFTRKILRSAKGALTAKQLAEVLNISPKTVFKLAKAGRIPRETRVFPSSHFHVCSLDSLGCRMWFFIPWGFNECHE
jgi:hypothetical protein